jgi:ribonuclease Y
VWWKRRSGIDVSKSPWIKVRPVERFRSPSNEIQGVIQIVTLVTGGLTAQILIAAVGLIAGVVIGHYYIKMQGKDRIRKAEETAARILEDAERENKQRTKEADLEMQEKRVRLKKDLEQRFEDECRERRKELNSLEKRLVERESKVDRRMENFDRRESELTQKGEQLNVLREELETLKERRRQKLEEISQLTREQAQAHFFKELEEELNYEVALRVKKAEEETAFTVDRKAKAIISTAIERLAVDHVSETLVSVVNLPSDDMKGRIIGREGRNIRTLEALTGVNIIIDDTPEAVIISGFNNVKKEIARLTLERLIADGRIHPARIEEMVAKVKKELDQKILQYGEQATLELGIRGLDPRIVKLLGRLHYRTSYGQNVLQHSIEVANLAGVMAAELGCDFYLAKRAGLLHDIGKAADHEIEGAHAEIGHDLLRKYRESKKVLNAVLAHHEAVPAESIEAVLVQVADAISAARAGARSESIDNYVKRLEKLEKIASAFAGVEDVYALQAGREIRVVVRPDKVDDILSFKMAYDIGKKIERELEYPGQIKVTVIRETRAVEIAK